MNISTGTKLMLFTLSLLMFTAVSEAQRPGPGIRVPQEKQNDRAPKKGNKKIKKLNPAKSKKEQEAKKKKDDKQYAEAVRKNRKHALDIQTPEVRERMKSNRKESDSNYKIKRKRTVSESRKAGRKYK
jgi:hypothetical protein